MILKTPRNPGDYPFRLLWLKCVRTPDGTTGDRPKHYVPNGYLWGSVTLESSNEEEELGPQRLVQYGTVKVRNWPNVAGEDRLYWGRFNLTLLIDGVRVDHSGNETVIDVHSLIDGVTYVTGSGGAVMSGAAVVS